MTKQRILWPMHPRNCQNILHINPNHLPQHLLHFIVYNDKQSQRMSANQSYISHLLNTSTSKQAHCFPKQKRFSNPHINTETIYKLPTTFNKRATSFGFGRKTDLAVPTSSPPPGSYHLPSEFERKDLMNVTSFGEGRTKISFGSFIGQAVKRTKHIPSPNRYYIAPIRCKIGGRISDRIKTQPDSHRSPQPGPAQYTLEATEMKNHGNFLLSTFKNNSCAKFFESKAPTTHKQPSLSISYDIDQKQPGIYPNSKYKNVPGRTFSKSRRLGLEDRSKLAIPGHKYHRFSQFGPLQ